VAGTCGYGEKLSGSINAGNFLTSCKVYWLASQEGLWCDVSDLPKNGQSDKECVNFTLLFPSCILNRYLFKDLQQYAPYT
jgi:hypothetical protein